MLRSLQQVEKHETVLQHENEPVNRNWLDEITIANKYEQDRPVFLQLLMDFEDM